MVRHKAPPSQALCPLSESKRAQVPAAPVLTGGSRQQQPRGGHPRWVPCHPHYTLVVPRRHVWGWFDLSSLPEFHVTTWISLPFSTAHKLGPSIAPAVIGRGKDDTVLKCVTREPPELHALACFVHGALTALHLLGAVYNCRRRNWWDVITHLAAAGYDVRSARHHHRVEQMARLRQASRGRADGRDDQLATPA